MRDFESAPLFCEVLLHIAEAPVPLYLVQPNDDDDDDGPEITAQLLKVHEALLQISNDTWYYILEALHLNIFNELSKFKAEVG